jgi:hypothetical protein
MRPSFCNNRPMASAQIDRAARNSTGGVLGGCGQIALGNGYTIADALGPSSKYGASSRTAMLLDTGQVFKRPVLCPHCREERLFTLRAIADNQPLKCHGCGGRICLSDRVYESLVSDVRNLLEAIDAVHAAPVFNGQPALTSPLGHNAFGPSMIGGRQRQN